MVNLEANSPCQDILPLTIGTVSLTEVILPEGKVWSVSPSPVKTGASKYSRTSKTLWIGRDHGLQIGGSEPKSAVVTQQSDAWACVGISGLDADAVLARLCPVDLAKLPLGAVARTLINHMSAIILVTDCGYEIFVYRGFSRSFVHELQGACLNVKARREIGL